MATTPYPFVASAVLTASQLNSTFNIPVATKTNNYVLVAADAGTRIVMNKATATTITVNTSLFSAGDRLEISNIGVGICTITPGTATVTGSLELGRSDSGVLFFTSASAAIFMPYGGRGAAKAWIHFDGTGTPSISASYNVTSLTDRGTGNYDVNFTVPFSSANYVGIGGSRTGAGVQSITTARLDAPTVSAGAFGVYVVNPSAPGTLIDASDHQMTFFGDQ